MSSSAKLRAAAVHALQRSQRVDRARYLRTRHEELNARAPALPVNRESNGRVLTLSTGRFGVLAPRAPKQRMRRPIGVAGSIGEAQLLLTAWRNGRNAIVAFVVWLAGGAR